MSRGYPADTKMQNFFTEQYDKEAQTRLQWYQKKKERTFMQGDADIKANVSSGLRKVKGFDPRIVNPETGLPRVNPNTFAKQMKLEQDNAKREKEQRIEALNAKAHMVEMRPPTPKTRNSLYNGFSREEKGRYQYLKSRHMISPEKKFEFPITSSWEYGWRIDELYKLHKPEYARTRKIKDTFYTRNGVPTLAGDPSSIERGYTIIA